MAITRNFNLFLNAGHSIPLVINANQYDQGESWVFTLFNSDGTQYIPETGAIVGIKSDGLGIINSGSVVDGKVVINETSQMTAAVGKAVFELLIDSQTHGTANFIVLVEEKPGNNADLSESDLSLLQEAIDATSPLPTGGSVGQVLTKTANGSAWSDAGTPTQEQVADAVSDWADEHITVSTGVVIDTSLAVAGAAADSKKVGDEISDLKSQLTNGVPYAVKQALDNILQNVAFKNNDVYTSDLATVHTWATSVNVTSISATFTQGDNVIYDTDSLDSLKQYLVVTANYDNGTTATLSDSAYTLSGTLTTGTSIITVAYSEKTTTFNVTVSAPTREMLFGVFTDGYGTIKANSAASYPSLGKHCYRSATAARATSQTPFANANKYIFTVTDSAKYNLLVDDVTSIEPVSTPLITQAVDGVSYRAGDKSVSWKTTDSVTTDYGWIGLRKMDGTAFTAEELANGAEAVFTYTEVS